MSLAAAFADIALSFSDALGGPYLSAEIVTAVDAVLDDGGSIVTPGGLDRAPCKAQVDAIDERARPEGWTDKDYRFLILSASIGVGDRSGDAPAMNADIKLNVTDANAPPDFRGTWLVSGLQRDPAAIGWAGKGRRAA